MLAMLAAAVALNVAVVAPAPTVTDAGTVSETLLLAGEIAIPPAGAATFSAAEQVEIWPPLKLPGAQVSEERAGTVTTLPAVVNPGSAEPVAATPTAPDTATDVVAALAARVSWMLAITPPAIAFAFEPASTHVYKPGAEEHERVFPAVVAAGPTVAPMAEIWLRGNTKVHCRPAGAMPPPPNERARPMVVPGAPVAEDKLRLETCAGARAQIAKSPHATARTHKLRIRAACIIGYSSVPHVLLGLRAANSCNQRFWMMTLEYVAKNTFLSTLPQ